MKTKQGGAREGAGRKRVTDKKIPVTVWFKKSTIKKFGGMGKFKIVVYDSIDSFLE